MEVNIYIGFCTLRLRCSQYGFCEHSSSQFVLKWGGHATFSVGFWTFKFFILIFFLLLKAAQGSRAQAPALFMPSTPFPWTLIWPSCSFLLQPALFSCSSTSSLSLAPFLLDWPWLRIYHAFSILGEVVQVGLPNVQVCLKVLDLLTPFKVSLWNQSKLIASFWQVFENLGCFYFIWVCVLLHSKVSCMLMWHINSKL